MKIIKLENGNVKIYQSDGDLIHSLPPNLSMYVAENNVIIQYLDGPITLDPTEITATQILPAAEVAFSGTNQDLGELLSDSFFFNASSGSNGGGGGKILYMVLDSIQDLNVIQPFTDLDFIEASNTIPNATVSSNFPIGTETYKGVVTLPPGKYKTSYRINCQNGSNTQKVVVTNISRYAPSVIFYPESTSYQMFRGNNNFASITNSDANYQFFELLQVESFGIISTRAAAAGEVNTSPQQSFWKIEKIE